MGIWVVGHVEYHTDDRADFGDLLALITGDAAQPLEHKGAQFRLEVEPAQRVTVDNGYRCRVALVGTRRSVRIPDSEYGWGVRLTTNDLVIEDDAFLVVDADLDVDEARSAIVRAQIRRVLTEAEDKIGGFEAPE
jgi:hypothetical protein